MILQELVRYYEQSIQRGEDIARPGYSDEKIHYALVLSQEGDFLQFDDLREHNGKKVSPRIVRVPKLEGRVGQKAVPAFLWDKFEYLFGLISKSSSEIVEDETRVWKCTDKSWHKFVAFREYHRDALEQTNSAALKSFVSFLEKWKPEDFERISAGENIESLLVSNFIIEIETRGKRNYLHQDSSLQDFWQQSRRAEGEQGICLVTGKRTDIARIHPEIKGASLGAQAKSALVSFNEKAYESYGKSQSFNSPISESAAFAYTTIINVLLQRRRQRIKIADTTAIFWAEKDTDFEDIFGGLLEPEKEDGFSKDVHVYLQKVKKGSMPDNIDGNQRFHILGVAPNSARLSIRFWYVNSVSEISKKLFLHFQQLELVRSYEKQLVYPGIWWLLIETSSQRKTENIPPNLAGLFMMSILKGTPYPLSLLSILLSRIRVDKNPNYYKCAMIKAILIRNFKKEVSVSLDKEKTDTAYVLGRLFAVLEKIQEDSAGGRINASIKDKYFASASTHPSVTFPLLIRLSQNHQKKLKSENPGWAMKHQKELQSILGYLDAFPSYLDLEAQGQFAIGYYHQYQSFYQKQSKQDNGTEVLAE